MSVVFLVNLDTECQTGDKGDSVVGSANADLTTAVSSVTTITSFALCGKDDTNVKCSSPPTNREKDKPSHRESDIKQTKQTPHDNGECVDTKKVEENGPIKGTPRSKGAKKKKIQQQGIAEQNLWHANIFQKQPQKQQQKQQQQKQFTYSVSYFNWAVSDEDSSEEEEKEEEVTLSNQHQCSQSHFLTSTSSISLSSPCHDELHNHSADDDKMIPIDDSIHNKGEQTIARNNVKQKIIANKTNEVCNGNKTTWMAESGIAMELPELSVAVDSSCSSNPCSAAGVILTEEFIDVTLPFRRLKINNNTKCKK